MSDFELGRCLRPNLFKSEFKSSTIRSGTPNRLTLKNANAAYGVEHQAEVVHHLVFGSSPLMNLEN